MKTVLNPKGLPKPMGIYSHSVVCPSGRRAYVKKISGDAIAMGRWSFDYPDKAGGYCAGLSGNLTIKRWSSIIRL